MKAKDGRDERGRFVEGNAGGPGRPPRPVERQYLEVLADVITLDKWRQVCEKRLEKALEGDEKAVEWLEKYLFGAWRLSLSDLALRERLGVTAETELEFKKRKETVLIHHAGLLESMTIPEEAWDEKPYLLQAVELAAEKRQE